MADEKDDIAKLLRAGRITEDQARTALTRLRDRPQVPSTPGELGLQQEAPRSQASIERLEKKELEETGAGRFQAAVTEPFEDLQGRFEGLLEFAGIQNVPSDRQRNFIEKLPKQLLQGIAGVATVVGSAAESALNVVGQGIEELTGAPREESTEFIELATIAIGNPAALRRIGAVKQAPSRTLLPAKDRLPAKQKDASFFDEAPIEQPELARLEAPELPVRGPTEPIARPLEGVVEQGPFAPPTRIDKVKKTSAGALEKFNETIDKAFPPETKVKAEINRALELDDINPADIPRIALEFEAKNGRRPSLSEITGENVEGVLGGSGGRLGKGRSIVEKNVETITAAQTSEVEKIADRTLSSPTKNFIDDIEKLEKKMFTESRPLYEKAFEQSVTVTDDIRAMVDTPAGKTALKRANKILKQEGKDPVQLGIVQDGKKITLGDDVSVEALDAIKRGFDDIVEKRRDPTTGILRLDQFSRSVDKTRGSFRDAVDQLAPDYKAARDAFAGPASLKDASISGRKAARGTKVKAADIEKRMGRMNTSERDIYRAGFMRGLIDQMTGKITTSNRIRNFLKTEDLREKITAVFGDKAASDAFIAQLEAASTRVSKAQAASSKIGSQTALRQQNQLGVTGGGKALIADAAKAAFDRLRQDRNVRNRQIADKEIAELLTQPLTDDVLKRISDRLGAN